MLRVGVDAIEIARIERAILSGHGKKFLKKIYTKREANFCKGRIPELAVRFAAKEAISKALGRGLLRKSPLKWQEIEILPDKYGRPEVYLSGKAKEVAEELGLQEIAISLCHLRNLAIAFVVCFSGRIINRE